MNESKTFICIVCPRGCHLTIDQAQNVQGHGCKRGKEYAITEAFTPMRTITSTVIINNGTSRCLPVKTDRPIPKAMIFDIVSEIRKVCVFAPIKCGDVIIQNVLNTGASIVATRTINIKQTK